MQTKQTVKDVTVFVAACWWRDNDPFTRIVGNDAHKVRTAAMSAMRDAAKDALQGDSDEDTTIETYLDELCWSGVHQFSLTDLVKDSEIPQLQPDYDELVSGDKDAILYLS
jgi:hypothetical protein